jgi:pyruvate dehydrogenase (quinone)
MSKTASDVLIESIISWGVDTIFGIPGDGINGIMEALRTRQDQVRFIQVRHEEAAAFMACAYAKYTGRLGCCLATSGPGGIHLLNGLYDAKMDQAPVLALTGATYSDLYGTNFQQEVNLQLLYEDVACYNQTIINPNSVDEVANEACRHAINERGVAHITFPIDYQIVNYAGRKKHSEHNVPGHTSAAYVAPHMVPQLKSLAAAADLINACDRPVILVGRGAIAARQEVIALAEKIGAPIVKALLGKQVVPDDHPYTTGGIGLLGTEPSQEAMENCNCLIMVGSSFPYTEFLPKPGQARGVQIDDKPDRIGLRYPVEVGLVGDSQPTLAALLPSIQQKPDKTWISKAQDGMKSWWQLMEKRATNTSDQSHKPGNGDGANGIPTPIKPERVAWELSKLASDDAIISGDSGTNTTWIARYFKMRTNQMFSCSGNLATMAPGLPYAIAAQVAYPNRQSIAFVGDGGFTMLMGEFATAVKYKLPIVVIIIKNNVLGQIKWEQIVFLGNPEYGVELQPIDFARYAEACGGLGISVTRDEELRPALERALASRVPTVIEVLVDANEPPMPPKIELKQAMKFAEALAKGEPGRGRIALTLFRDKLNELM